VLSVVGDVARSRRIPDLWVVPLSLFFACFFVGFVLDPVAGGSGCEHMLDRRRMGGIW
jgi:hypothetical protein